MKAKIIAIGIVVVMLFGIIGLLAQQSGSLLSVSKPELGSDGKIYWTFFLASGGQGERIQFSSPSPKDIDAYTDKEGGKTVAQRAFWVQFDAQQPTCTYSLERINKPLDGVVNYIKNRFGAEIVYHYTVSEGFTQSAPIAVTTSKNTKPQYMDGFDRTSRLEFTDGRDGKGTIIIQAQGGLVGTNPCIATGGDLKVAEGQDFGTLEYYTENEQNVRSERTSWERAYSSCTITDGAKQDLICTPKGSPGVGTVTVTADAEYLDARYYPPTQGKPKITSIDADAQVRGGTYGSIVVKVKNVGTDSGTFALRADSPLSIIPASTIVTLRPGEEQTVGFNVVGKSVNEDTKQEVEFSLCTTEQFSGSTCASKKTAITLTPGTVEGARCGDNQCQITETSSTCPNDCENVKQCDATAHLRLDVGRGACVCEEGFNLQQDNLGRTYCQESAQISSASLIAAGIILVIILGMVALKMNKGKKKRGKRR